MTAQDLINAATSDPAKVAADVAAIAAAQAAEATDKATQVSDSAALDAILATGPVSTIDPSVPPQFVTVYTAGAAGAFTTQVIPLASSVTVPPAPPAPAPAPTS